MNRYTVIDKIIEMWNATANKEYAIQQFIKWLQTAPPNTSTKRYAILFTDSLIDGIQYIDVSAEIQRANAIMRNSMVERLKKDLEQDFSLESGYQYEDDTIKITVDDTCGKITYIDDDHVFDDQILQWSIVEIPIK